MEKIQGYELITEWKNSQCGKTARASRDRKVYFLKKYQTPVEPVMNGALDERTFNANKIKFEEFVERRRKVNTALRTIAGEGGNIVIPRNEFVDDHHYVEAAEFVDGAIIDDELETLLSTLSLEVKKLLMLTAAGALVSVHRLGIVHSDLKLKNVLLAKNRSGNYVAKLIDFDSSYFLDDIPDEVTGDINFYSPELGKLSVCDEEDKELREELKKNMTDKSDIFSLGLIFHRYLSGEMPQAKSLTEKLQKRKDKGKAIYCWTVLNSGCELQLSDNIKSLKYKMLIHDMLSIDPADRPSASEVLQRLKAAEEDSVIEEPWAEHRISVDSIKLKNKGYVSFKKGKAGAKNYILITADGKKVNKTKDELISDGIARVVREEKFAEPWPEHSFCLNESKLRSRGFVASEQREYMGVKGYEVFRSDESSQFFTVEKLISMGYANKGSMRVEEGFCSPWAEHKISFDKEQIKSKGYISAVQKEMGGVKGYSFIKTDGTEQFIRLEMLILLKMAKRI